MAALRTHREPASTGAIDLPPGFELVTLRERGDAFAHATAIAAERGAGTIVWARRADMIELAVVLEPDEPLHLARRAVHAVMIACVDALAGSAPAEKPVEIGWPATLLVDGGIVGGARLAWPRPALEEAAPAWMVAGLVLRRLLPHDAATKGAHPLDMANIRGTGLLAEGFEDADATAFIAGFSRHLLLWTSRWLDQGFPVVRDAYLDRLVAAPGIIRRIEDNGDLSLRRLSRPTEIERRLLIDALRAVDWLDPASMEPVL